MRRRWELLAFVAASASLAFAPFAPAADAGAESGGKVTFLTRNLYLGADLAPAIETILGGNPFDILASVGTTWGIVQATDFPTRVVALADEITEGKPDLVGLQEAALWRIGPGLDPAPAEEVVYDFIGLLIAELDRRGHPYEVVTSFSALDIELPGFVSASYDIADIRLTQRDAILARKGGAVRLANAQTGTFSVNLVIPGLIEDVRGWASVDCRASGTDFRFVTAHLDNVSSIVRHYQSLELLAGPCDTTLPVVLVGDLNSDGNGSDTGGAYLNVIADGFSDAWVLTRPDEVGLTFGHDELLANPVPFQATSDPIERIDFVFFRGDGITAYDSDRLGEDPADRIDGLWPSDHAGVIATLRFAHTAGRSSSSR